MITKPMLAYKLDVRAGDLERLVFPVVGTPKVDGHRCLIIDGKPVTRTFLPVANRFTRQTLTRLSLPSNLDGELTLKDRRATFQEVSSAFGSFDGEPAFTYHVFDLVTRDGGGLGEPYHERLLTLKRWCQNHAPDRVRYLTPAVIEDLPGLLAYESLMLGSGYEGIMIRSALSPYKLGRSTLREGYLLALKRFVDAEAVIIGFEEQEANLNPSFKGEAGQTKRSSAKAGKVLKGTLGAFVVRGIVPGREHLGEQEFNIGTGKGLTAELRQQIWDARARYLGRAVKYKFQDAGTKELPRILSFQGFRAPEDM